MANKPRLRPYTCTNNECSQRGMIKLHITQMTDTEVIRTCQTCAAVTKRPLFAETKRMISERAGRKGYYDGITSTKGRSQ